MGSQPAMWRAPASDDVTGSIPKPPTTLSPSLEPEDWRRANAALNTALDPQGSGASVNWDNPETGARGSITPSGLAFPHDDKICRTFHAELLTNLGREALEGAACREKSADWSLIAVAHLKKG